MCVSSLRIPFQAFPTASQEIRREDFSFRDCGAAHAGSPPPLPLRADLVGARSL